MTPKPNILKMPYLDAVRSLPSSENMVNDASETNSGTAIHANVVMALNTCQHATE